MSESAVLDDVTLEAPAAATPPARPIENPAPAKKPKRFVANLRFNGLRYLVLATSLGLAWGLLRAATLNGAGKPESTFMLALAGGLLAAAAKTVIDILEWAAVARQTTHIERVRAVQRVFQRACVVREQAILDWRRIHTRLVDNLSGQSQTIRLFHDHDETDRQSEALFQKALSEEMWIRVEGVDAVRRFKKDIAALDYDGLATEPAFMAAFNGLMNGLRRDLALASIGVPID